MKTLQWRHTDWTTRKYEFQSGLDTVGKLVFGQWNSSAVYLAGDSRLAFSEVGFWRNTINISRDKAPIAKIKCEAFGPYILKLNSGEVYHLKRIFFGHNIHWVNADGTTIATYQSATFSSKGKGTLNFTQSLSEETEQLLASSGLYLSLFFQRRMLVITIAALIPAMMNGH